MHISWRCSNCLEKHVSILYNSTIVTNSEFNLLCSNCNSKFTYSISSIKYSAKCVVTDSNTHVKSNDNIIAF